ncbi:MAG: hypothetical protein O3A37_04115 [Planctomycetota bacterium]|nr:hypothetical protein [Planctomycetota bacterium]
MEAFLPLTWSAALRSTAMVTALAMMAVPAPALAQQRYQAGPPQMTTLAKEHGKGTVAKVAPGLLMLKLQNIMWAALPAPGAAIEVTGSASREMLQPKQFVSCNVTLDGLGKPAGAAEMVVLTDGGVPGVMAAGVSDMLQQRRGPRPAGSYTVSGPIQMVDGDMMTVMVGRERFEITVPEETELVVRSQNVTLASEGDEVEVEGKYFQVGQLMVTSLKIMMIKPLVPPPPKGRRPAAGN